MLLSRILGIFMIVMVFFGTIFASFMLNENRFVFKLFLMGPTFLCIGIAMLIFPGIQVKHTNLKNYNSLDFFKELPLNIKIIWSTFGLLGYILFKNYHHEIYLILKNI